MVTERPNGQTKHQAEKLLQAHLEAKTTQPADFTKSTAGQQILAASPEVRLQVFQLAEDSKIKDRSIMRQIKSDGV